MDPTTMPLEDSLEDSKEPALLDMTETEIPEPGNVPAQDVMETIPPESGKMPEEIEPVTKSLPKREPGTEASILRTLAANAKLMCHPLAKKLFLSSTDGIFPGFAEHFMVNDEINANRYSARIRRQIAGATVFVRSSLLASMIIQASFGYFLVYMACIFGTLDLTLNRLKPFHQILFITLYIAFIFINFCRFTMGWTSNRDDEAIQMTTYWMLTFIVQFPMLLFLLLTNLFVSKSLHFVIILDFIMLLFLLAELIITLTHIQMLVKDELSVMKLANEAWKALEKHNPLAGTQKLRINHGHNGPEIKWCNPSDSEPRAQVGSENDESSSDDSEPKVKYVVASETEEPVQVSEVPVPT